MTNADAAMIRISTPFAEPGDPPLLVHGCYHKAGTHWLRKILRLVSDRFGLAFHAASDGAAAPASGILFDSHSRFDLGTLSHFRGSHMIRDPRDIVVSAYYYHLWTDESWAHQPQEKYNGQSYQEHLKRLDREAGLMAEIDRCGSLFRRMRTWNYDDPRFYEIKYEEMLIDEDRILRELFSSYGFHDEAVATATELGRRCSFRAITGRALGEVQANSVTRSGKSGQWRELFSDAVKERFGQSTGDLLTRLGYESGDRW